MSYRHGIRVALWLFASLCAAQSSKAQSITPEAAQLLDCHRMTADPQEVLMIEKSALKALELTPTPEGQFIIHTLLAELMGNVSTDFPEKYLYYAGKSCDLASRPYEKATSCLRLAAAMEVADIVTQSSNPVHAGPGLGIYSRSKLAAAILSPSRYRSVRSGIVDTLTTALLAMEQAGVPDEQTTVTFRQVLPNSVGMEPGRLEEAVQTQKRQAALAQNEMERNELVPLKKLVYDKVAQYYVYGVPGDEVSLETRLSQAGVSSHSKTAILSRIRAGGQDPVDQKAK